MKVPLLFKKSTMFSFLMAGSLILAGCGSNSSKNNDPETSDLTTETIGGVTVQIDEVEETTSGITVDGTTATLTGKAMDGYLENATVCLDTNRNGACDSDEPTTTSDSEGDYALSGVSAEDAAKYPIIVEVVKGQTIDKDTGTAAEKSYTMKAPAGQASVVSPITTLIQNTLENNPAMTVEKAEKQLKTALGMDENVSLMSDYVEKSSAEDGEVYKVIHKVAQVVAEKVAETLESVEASSTQTLDEESKNALASLIYDEAMDILEEVISKIEIVTLSGVAIDDINTTTLNVSLDTSSIDEAAISEKQESLATNEIIADSVVKVAASTLYQDSLKNGDVFYFWPTATYNSDTGTYEFAAWTYGEQVVDNKLVWNVNEYNATSEVFEPRSESDLYGDSDYTYTYTDTVYLLTDSGWEKKTVTNEDEDDTSVTFQDDGNVLWTETATGYQYQYNVSAIIPLKGISIAQYAASNIDDREYATIDSSVFPEGSLAFEIGFKALSEEYEVWSGGDYCYSSTDSITGETVNTCNSYNYGYIHTGYGSMEHNVTSIDELKEVYALNNSEGQFYYDNESIYPYIQFSADGTVHYFGYDYTYNETYNYYTLTGGRIQRELTGQLAKKTVNGQELWFIERPSAYEDNFADSWAKYYDEFIVQIDGILRQGEVYYPGRESLYTQRFYNNAACLAMAKSVTGVNVMGATYTAPSLSVASPGMRTTRNIQNVTDVTKTKTFNLPTPHSIKRDRMLSRAKKQ